MSLPRYAMDHPTTVVTVVALITIWGILSFATMPRREDPAYTVRTCVVVTEWPGASATQVEELISDPIESALDGIDAVKLVYSTSTAGLSVVYVDAEDSVGPNGIDNVWDKVRSRVALVPLPDPTLRPIVNDEFGDTNFVLIAVHQRPRPGESEIREEFRYTPRELDKISERVEDDLKLIPNVAKTQRLGVREEAIFLETDLGAWSQLQLSTDDLSALLRARNIIAPGGQIDTEFGRFFVKPTGDFTSPDQLGKVVVGQHDNDLPVHLEDLGVDVVRGYEDPPRVITRFTDSHSSEPCVMIACTMKDGANVVALGDEVLARLDALQNVELAIPPDIEASVITNQAATVTAKINDFLINVAEAIAIVVGVAFLMVGLRIALVMASAIPVVIFGSLGLVTLFDVELEQVSIASMIIALGMLVDNAIGVCDQSRAYQLQGLSPREAAIRGTETIMVPVLYATLTTLAAFLPMLFALQGSTQEYIYSLPVTLTVVLGFSWILAVTFTTLTASWFIRVDPNTDRPASPLLWLVGLVVRHSTEKSGTIERGYRRLVAGALRMKLATVAGAAAALIATLSLPVGSEFFPTDARSQFVVDVHLPNGATIAQTEQACREVELALQELSVAVDSNGSPLLDEESGDEIQRFARARSVVGAGGMRWYLGLNPESAKPNYAEICVQTTDPRFTRELVRELRKVAEEGDANRGISPIVGARVVPRQLSMGPPISAPIGLRIYGQGFADLDVMQEAAQGLESIVRRHSATWDVHNVWGSSGHQLRVEVDEERANLSGVTNASIARTLDTFFSGLHLTTYREADHTIPVYLRLPESQRGDLGLAASAYVEGNTDKVPIDSVAETTMRWEPARIDRRQLNRMIEVRARVEDGHLANDVLAEIKSTAEYQEFVETLPGDLWLEVGGEQFESDKSEREMGVSLIASLVLIILCLVIQYNSLAKPLIILTTLPLALIGAILGLYATGNVLGFMPQLGILSLFGIVLNTAIIYLEFAEILIRQKLVDGDGVAGPDEKSCTGLTRQAFRACLAKAGAMRLLPISLTTLTTVGGLIPLALFGGPLWEGMAYVLIWGLLLATGLTLIVLPAVYAIFVETFGLTTVRVSPTDERVQS